MNCAYCSKEVQFVFVMQENVPGIGPSIRHACFPCLQTIGERVMKAFNQAQLVETTPLDVTSLCRPCGGCGGIRRENCTNFGLHAHIWCDCQ